MIARSNALYELAPITQNVIAIIGLATALFAASIAIKQNDIKKVLAYSTVSQLGFMFIAIGTGNYIAAVFHVVTHAFFKALLFLGSGSVIHAMGGEQDIRNMGGLHKYMKVTSITFLIGCLAIAGIPGFSGFFSKDEILAGAFGYSSIFYGFVLVAALLTAFYMFRLYIITFTGSFRGSKYQQSHLHESPLAIILPLITLAVLSIVGGYIGLPEALGGHHQLAAFLKPVIAQHAHTLTHSTEYILMALSTTLVLCAIALAYFRFRNYQPEGDAKGFGRVLENKWYVDEIYDTIIVQPLRNSSAFFKNIIEKKGIDGLVNGVGKAVQYSSRQIRLVQSGNVGAYVLLMVIGMLVLLVLQFIIQ